VGRRGLPPLLSRRAAPGSTRWRSFPAARRSRRGGAPTRKEATGGAPPSKSSSSSVGEGERRVAGWSSEARSGCRCSSSLRSSWWQHRGGADEVELGGVDAGFGVPVGFRAPAGFGVGARFSPECGFGFGAGLLFGFRGRVRGTSTRPRPDPLPSIAAGRSPAAAGGGGGWRFGLGIWVNWVWGIPIAGGLRCWLGAVVARWWLQLAGRRGQR
jgi:hypothetical protein